MTISIGAVRDWGSAAELLRRSWKPGREAVLEYTPEFLLKMSEYPSDLTVLAPAYYDGDTLFAFVAGFPRCVRLEGHARKLLLMSFFTVSPEYRGKGYGRAIWTECLREAKRAGYEGAIHYCVDGNPSNEITLAAAKEAGFETRRVFTVRFLMRLLRPGAGVSPEPAANTGLFLKSVARLNPSLPLTRLWSETDATWHLQDPARLCCADSTGGMLTGTVLRTKDTAHTPCFSIEDVLWDDVAPAARAALLHRLLT